VAARDVLSGKIRNPQADALRQALANITSGKGAASMGSSAAGTTGSGTKAKNDKMENERSRDR
jgi:hypothetical protein